MTSSSASVQSSSSSSSTNLSSQSSSPLIQIDWTANGHHETFLLLNALTSDERIRYALFPGPHTRTRSVKTDWNWKLAIVMFKGHETYAQVFKPAIRKAELRGFWSDLVKGRLDEMVEIALKHYFSLGPEGKTLWAENQLVPGSPLHSKWLVIKQTTPWYFEVNELIGDRPDLKPYVINSRTPLDLDCLRTSKRSDSTSNCKRKRVVEPESEERDFSSDGEEEFFFILATILAKKAQRDMEIMKIKSKAERERERLRAEYRRKRARTHRDDEREREYEAKLENLWNEHEGEMEELQREHKVHMQMILESMRPGGSSFLA
ncbi:hypothetical protein BDQ17DRAFT_1545698 [Cyathus striatus]|nr:hypothetical protein BDQ17DRAFT_1545698 [Cyathus striatus]